MPGSAPVPAAHVAGGVDLHRHPCLDAPQRVVERETHARLEVGAPLRARTRALPAAAAEEAAELPEQVGEVADVDVLEARASRPSGPEATRPRSAEAVVLCALLGVGEEVVGALHLLEPALGVGVAGVRVGVHLADELAVRLLDLVVGRGLRDAEDLVGAGHGRSPHSATITRAGRRTTSPSR